MPQEPVDLLADKPPVDLLESDGPVDLLETEKPLIDKIKDWYWAPTEAALTIGTSTAAFLSGVPGLVGLAAGAAPGGLGDEDGVANAEGVESASAALDATLGAVTYGVGWGREQTEESRAITDIIAWPFEKWREHVSRPVGAAAQDGPSGPSQYMMRPEIRQAMALDGGGSTGLATGLYTASEIVPYVLGPKVVRSGHNKLKSSEALATTAETVKEIVSPISTGSQQAQAIAKTYANSAREAAAMRNNKLASIDRQFTRKEQEAMGDALAKEEVAFAKGEQTSAGLDSLNMSQREAALDLLEHHKVVAEQAVELGIIPASNEFYFPRKALSALPLESSARVYGSRAVKTTTKHAKKRKHETIEETEAAIVEALGSDVSINRNIKILPLVTAELEAAIAGKTLIKAVREEGTRMGVDAVKYGTEDSTHFTINHPAFREYRPRVERRPDGQTGPNGGKWKIVKTDKGEPVFDAHQIKVHKDFEGPLTAILDNQSGPAYRALMKLKAKSMSAIMFSPFLHGQVIWGKVLPFQVGRTITFKNYREGHMIQNIRGKGEAGLEKWQKNEAWIRNESNGEFAGSNQAIRQALRDGYVPIESMGWEQRINDIIGTPSLEAGRSTTARIVGAAAKPFGKEAQAQAMRGVDWAGGIWHDKFLWEQIRSMGYGLWFNLRNQAIKKGIPPEIAGQEAAHLANRFTGSIPFEDMSQGVRKVANLMLFSKSFTGTNLGLYKDATLGFPKAVQSKIIQASGDMVGFKKANSKLRQQAAATLAKDIAFVYILNSMLQNAVQMWKAENKEEAWADIIDQYDENSKVYAEYAQNPAAAIYYLDELMAGSINDPGKEDRIFIGRRPDGTAIYGRSPLGKVGEDLLKAMTEPVELGWNKLSPSAGFVAGVALNDKSKQRGFDIEVYDPEGGMLENMRDVAHYFLESHTPYDYAEAIVGAALGDKDEVLKWQAMLQPLGVSFSKGAPGGPASGTVFAAEDAYRRAIRRAAPKIKKKIDNGDYEGAVQVAIEAGMRPQEIEAYLRRKGAPMLSEGQIKNFLQIAEPHEIERLNRQFEQFYGTESQEN
jgi:hypothetical protein